MFYNYLLKLFDGIILQWRRIDKFNRMLFESPCIIQLHVSKFVCAALVRPEA
jgi:hypothetical protein